MSASLPPSVSSMTCVCCHTSRCFIMTKRDSQSAELPSPGTLNMESHDIDMPTAGPHSYAAPAIPGPDSHPQATSSTTPSSNHPPQIPPLIVSNVAHRGRPRQRVGHSILFKILEQPLPMGGFSREILVEETDARGPVGIPNQSLWSSSSMASSDTSVTHGDTHWTMIDCALSLPITGGPGSELQRLAQCLMITPTLCPGRIPNRNRRRRTHLLLPAPSRNRRCRSRPKSCRWLGC